MGPITTCVTVDGCTTYPYTSGSETHQSTNFARTNEARPARRRQADSAREQRVGLAGFNRLLRPGTLPHEVLAMAIAINFDKAKAERLVDALTNKKPLDTPRDVDDVLALAGACFYAAMSQAPALHKAVDWSRVGHHEQDEDQDTFFADLHAAIEYYGQLMMLVAAGEYDDSFDPRHKAIVMMQDDRKTVIPVEGVRGELDDDDEDEDDEDE